MIRRFALVLGLALSVSVCSAQVILGVHAGVHQHTVDYTITDIPQPVTAETGFEAGVNLKVFFEEKLFFNPFLFYSLKKYRVSFNSPSYPPSDAAVNNDVTMHTVEFAPLLQYDFSYNPSHFFIRFGPSVDIGVGGKEKFDLNNNTTQSQSVTYSNTQYSRVALSAIGHLGYEFNNSFSVFGYYEYGFGSRNNADDGPKIFHRVLGIAIGKYFGRNPNVFNTSVKR
jgi:hypothetical protein